jgi:hypothetical protein
MLFNEWQDSTSLEWAQKEKRKGNGDAGTYYTVERLKTVGNCIQDFKSDVAQSSRHPNPVHYAWRCQH